MPEDDDPKSRFVKFKQHVDAHVSAGLHSLFGIPSMVTQGFNLNVDRRTPQDGSASKPSRAGHGASPEAAGNDDASLAAWEEQESATVEARLDQCRGGLREDHEYAWNLFLQRSRYSPFRLEQEMPLGPCPADLEAGMDPDTFGWTDAFEDLLRASSSLPMMNVRERYAQKKAWSGFFGDREPEHLAYWRLRAYRLPEAYFPYRDYNYQSPQTMEQWVQLRRSDEDEQAAWQNEGFRRAREIARAFGISTDTLASPTDDDDATREPEESDDRDHRQKRAPENEQEMYDFLEATKAVLPPLTSLVKAVSDGKWETESSSSSSSSSSSWTRNGAAGDDGPITTSKSTEEWTKYGHVHVKTEIRRTTADGREVSRETHYSVRSAEAPQQQQQHERETGEEEKKRDEQSETTKVWTRDAEGEKDKKSSWLWK